MASPKLPGSVAGMSIMACSVGSACSSLGLPFGGLEDAVHPAKFVAVQRAQAAQQSFPLAGQCDPHRPCVIGIRRPLDEALALCPADQFDDAVMSQLQAVGQLPHHRPVAVRETLERQHELVLLRRHPVAAHGFLAEAQVAPDAEAEARQRFKVLLGQRFSGLRWLHGHGEMVLHESGWSRSHNQKVSCYDTFCNAATAVAASEAHLRRSVVLSDREQRVLDDLERNYDAEAASPASRPGPRLRRGRWRDGRSGRHPLRAFVAGLGAMAVGWGSLQLLTPATGAL